MPAPTLPTETIDDDEGFDWEAAVREIDAACTINSASTSNNVHPVTSVYCNMQIPAGSSSRQSTLDHFLVKPCPRSSLEPIFEANVTNLLDNNDERPCCVDIDPEAAKTWIYPVNVPLRDYQFSITKTALFSNTLVALPTGLGKTLIAAVVMYNFFRWFPEGKIVFAAPSRPLVMQQIEACHNIVGIPLEWTIDMTGQTSPGKRAFLWKSKRVFFVTPQVFEKDIQSGTCMIKNIVCLVVDEAHRAMGNYAYSVAVRELMAAPLQLRILALSATPGSKQQTIQQIIDNLHISMLEYRNESDPDVSPYVHNRKLDLIVVPMGKDADEINNLLSEVIRPFVTKLSAMGVLQYRDFQNLSPCELLNARDKFRLARPPNVPELRCREIEGYFGVLITLYHIRKLLSSHGIMPAYEMLEDKLHQSSFARLMSRNEDIHKAKLLMQKCISHGAPSPKLSKLTDVLVDHFKSNNPQSSRVIIFSNFRGSVRDIMNTLGNIGEHVKATEFIGQSAGKILKGQSQKVQQAVLEKFRAGGYNVIVATSIGEEGLDIMEVDLVICFDANISPLRMIQRMGRTGRKNDGRVVVLACEGSEVKGYMRKQAKSKTLGKHMQKGGLNSFRFHSSPRMIPHVFKPEVQLVELSIEQFVRRGRTVTDDHSKNNHTFSDNLTDNQIESITKYFHPDRGNRLRLSLIAFPHFQAFSSRVHKVIHSFRTGILIDSMRQLQEIPVSIDGKNPAVTDEAPADQCVAVDTFGQHAGKQLNISSEGNFGSRGLEINTKLQSGSNILDFEVSSTQSLDTKGHHNLDNLTCQNPPTHSFLFGSEFVSVDANGMIQILSVPFLSMEESPTLKYASTGFSILLNSKEEYLTRDYIELTLKSKDMADSLSNSQPLCAKTIDVSMIQHSSEGQCLDGKENVLGNKSQIQLVNDTGDDIKDTQHSPGLTNLIKSGVVPESPLSGCDFDGVNHDFFAPNAVSPTKFQPEGLEKSSPPNKTDLVAADLSCGTPDPNSPKNVDFHSAVSKTNSMMRTACGSPFLTSENMQSPFDNLTGNSCCKDWLLSSAEKSESAERRSKFKRLRKFGDSCRKSTKRMKLNTLAPTKNVSVSCADSSSISKKHCLGNREEVADVRTYLEDEAEISSDACISDDEEDEEADSFDESFIDDRINPTAAGTQAEAGGADMMAIYRRSLLSQSPMVNLPNSPRSVTPSSEASGNESYSGKTCSLVTPLQTEPLTCKPLISSRESDFRMEILKRKRSFLETRSTPVMNLTKKFLENEVDELSAQHQVEKTEENGDLFYNDDHFYASIDLDAVEAQATILFKKKTTDLSLHKQEKPPDLTHNLGLLASPSFDLGI